MQKRTSHPPSGAVRISAGQRPSSEESGERECETTVSPEDDMWMMSPAMAITVARQQTIDEVRQSRKLKVARIAARQATVPARGRHRARRHTRAFWSVHLHSHHAH
jgi:hypothetical protein